ncbi:concanavalin A-like lectin/glucanase [Hypomontagnella monticulosa]|nr:concanavalin A-like lectin/glucanase [Hypomontagnella monticulosa]
MKVLHIWSSVLLLGGLKLAAAQGRDSYSMYAGARIGIPNDDPNTPAIKRASAEWTVPKLCVPSGGNPANDYLVAAWVGFIGNGCSGTRGALAQAGVTLTLKHDGTTTADPWVEWYPKAAEFKKSIQVNAGDTVVFTIEVTSKSAGQVTISNKSNGQSVIEPFQSSNPSDPAANLCGGSGDAWAVIETTGAQPANSNILPGFADITFNNFETIKWANQQKYTINNQEAVLYDMKPGDVFATTERVSNTGFRIHSTKGSCN